MHGTVEKSEVNERHKEERLKWVKKMSCHRTKNETSEILK